MSFNPPLTSFAEKYRQRMQNFTHGVVNEVQRSIVEGSEITAAPGQPVDTGNLRASWSTAYESPTVARISTNVEYARPIEDGVGPHGPLTLRSAVGGFHSIALTVAGFDRIVESVRKDVGGP